MKTSEVAWWKEPTKAQWLTFGAAWIGWVLDSFDFMVFLLVQRQMAKEFHASLLETGGIIAATLLVRLVGGYAAGSVADRWGRKLPLMISMVWFAFANGSIYFMHSMTAVLILRVLFGFGMGAEYTSGTTMAMENWPARSRSIASGILQGSWGLGFILAALAVRYTLPTHGWRPLFLMGAIPALLVVPIRFLVPEEHKPQPEPTNMAKTGPVRPSMRFLVRRIFLASMVTGIGMMCYYSFVSHYAAAMQIAMQNEFQVPLMQSVRTSMDLSIVFNLGFFVGSAICGVIIKRKGIVTAVVVPSLIMLPLIFLYVGRTPSGPLPMGLWWVGAFLGGSIGVGWSGIVPVYLTGIFPPSVRARAVGIVYHVAAAMGAAIPFAIPYVHKLVQPSTGWTLATVMGVFIAVLEVALTITLLLQPKEMLCLSEFEDEGKGELALPEEEKALLSA